jgi:hypothetical protein
LVITALVMHTSCTIGTYSLPHVARIQEILTPLVDACEFRPLHDFGYWACVCAGLFGLRAGGVILLDS